MEGSVGFRLMSDGTPMGMEEEDEDVVVEDMEAGCGAMLATRPGVWGGTRPCWLLPPDLECSLNDCWAADRKAWEGGR